MMNWENARVLAKRRKKAAQINFFFIRHLPPASRCYAYYITLSEGFFKQHINGEIIGL
jgi:hypothetical protein